MWEVQGDVVHRVKEVDVATGVFIAEKLVDDPVAVLELCLLLLLEDLLVRGARRAARGLLLLLRILLAVQLGSGSSPLRAVVSG